jgi:hypothetical protein
LSAARTFVWLCVLCCFLGGSAVALDNDKKPDARTVACQQNLTLCQLDCIQKWNPPGNDCKNTVLCTICDNTCANTYKKCTGQAKRTQRGGKEASPATGGVSRPDKSP